MKVTIATHNGHVVAYRHNIRDRSVTDKEKHIDPNGWHSSYGKPEREAYEEIFGQAVNEYNEKQKRQERKIESYYDTVKRDSRKHTAYELIVGVYPAKGEQLSDEEQKQILSEYIKDFQKNNPNMKIFALHFHFDEESPHLHLDYIPVGHGFKRGMRIQNSLTKALEGQGFITQGKETAQIQWERSENERLERICKAHGLEVEHPQRGQNVQHLETELYKVKKELAEQKEAMQTIESSFHVFQALEEQYKISMDKTSLELFCEQEGIDYNELMRLFSIEPNKEKARKQSQGNNDDIELEL